jgi:hypothetical protein
MRPTPSQTIFELPPSIVESVVRTSSNGPLIAAAAQLWIRSADRVLDVTYGNGLFWTHFRPERLILPPAGTDFRSLPYSARSLEVVVFDPPYIAQGGRDTSGLPDFLERYGLRDCPRTVPELEALISAGIMECARVLAPSGRLMVKCMDYISGGRFRRGPKLAVEAAESTGLEQVDEFVHHSSVGPQPLTTRSGTPRGQVHSRRSHSFLCIFQRPPIWRNTKQSLL